MNKTLRISFSLRNAYKVNSILFSLKQIPAIKNLLPASLYGVRELIILANVLAVIWEIVEAVSGKLLYFLLMLFLIPRTYHGMPRDSLFLHVLLCLSILGAIINTNLLRATKEKYYAVILMRMNARECTYVDCGYSILKLMIGFLAFGLLFGRLAGVPVWVCLLIPLFVAGLKMTVAASRLTEYEKTGEASGANVPPKWVWLTTSLLVVLLAAAYALPAFKMLLPWQITAALMTIPVFTGAFSARKIYTFAYYREYYQQILKPTADPKATTAELRRSQNDKLILADTPIASKRKGFEYLNELFIKRHRKLLWRPAQMVTLVFAGIITVILVGVHFSPEMAKGVNDFLMMSLPLFVFLMYMVNRGTGFTQALFMNCDHSLLTYSFYKQPKFMLRLFRIRLREIIKINLLPACIIGAGLALLLFVSGGTDDWLNYVVLTVSVPAFSVFFSVHYLTIYYLLQPYNTATEIKSAVYRIVTMLTYTVCYSAVQLNLPTLIFGAMVIVFCVLYSVVACILVYKIAPKTFRLRT